MMKKLILVCGPAGIGKSTFCRRYRESHPDEIVAVVSADDTRCEMLGGYDKFPKGGNMMPVYDKMCAKAKALVAEHESVTVIFDTTNLTDKRRLFYMDRLGDVFDWFELIMLRLHDYSKCLERNARRIGARKVPEQVIRDMCDHYEDPTPETIARFNVYKEIYVDD